MAKLRCIVIGAGISGVLITHRIKESFSDEIHVQIFEKNADVGGTWLENRYPGCACDVPSHIYQYSFALNPYWSKLYASSGEIQSYIKTFVKHFDIERHISFSRTITKAQWDDEQSLWTVEVDSTDTYECEVLINAGGILNKPNYPRFKDLDMFTGQVLHTATWDTTADLQGKKVAVIGAGASAIQLLPVIQKQVARADVYIRTPSWITPALGSADGGNRPYTKEEVVQFANDPDFSVKTRKEMESLFNGMTRIFMRDSVEQKKTRAALESRMKELIPDESLQRKLIPEFQAGCRRFNPGEPYLKALQEPNVEPRFDPIEEITSTGVRCGGKVQEADIIILATGFDTSFRPRFPIIGRNDRNLQDLWAHDPVSYLGIAVSGYPNYLTFLGPNTPIANGSLMGSLEATADLFIKMLTKVTTENVKSFDVQAQAQADFDSHTQEFMKGMVWSGTCRSWYKNGDGKVTAIWPGSSLHYREVLVAGRFEDWTWKYKKNRFSNWGDGASAAERVEDTATRDLAYYLTPRPNLPAHLFSPPDVLRESKSDVSFAASPTVEISTSSSESDQIPLKVHAHDGPKDPKSIVQFDRQNTTSKPKVVPLRSWVRKIWGSRANNKLTVAEI
ncbi:putative FAD-containing monooxygenase [Byssothecium circinans]|uniref:Putative FAD-containing monooxygenase n=1 Tax=Byssothecium circinans TaxID=147558 RepID=A0A6A5TVY8_9PLEO|nr:putative FAD-containing monooxygenase [Byssothecium circinans]